MSRLLSASGYVVSLCLVSMPLAAQDLRAMAERLDHEVAASARLRTAVGDWRTENRRFKGAADSVTIAGGAIKVVATANAIALARSAARIADSVLLQHPRLTEAIRGAVASIEVDTSRHYNDRRGAAIIRFSINPGAGAISDLSEMNPDLVARMIEEAATGRALDRTRGPYYRWHRANPPQRVEDLDTVDWGAVRYDVLGSRSLLGPRCYKGEIGACTMLLGLDTVDDPVMAWYDSLARFDAVSSNAERARRFSREATDRCLAGDDAACGRALRAIHMYELPPGGGGTRDALMRQALIMGGEGAVDRLITAKGTAGDALAAAAGVPLDSVVKAWHHQLQEASLGSDVTSPLMVIVAIIWIGILFGLSTRISRWR
jgi:hypothetical protein